ncbi:hypothetical protein IH575_04620, partial [Candidatus Dojkabacteria bacterium]|nr:hypothetical protein [Candidatus Dojkabacteria bacterium]
MVKRIFIISLIFCGFNHVYSQDCFDKVAKQAVLIDSLEKVIKDMNNQSFSLINELQATQKALSDTIKSLKSDLSSLETYKSQKKSTDAQLKTKSDSISTLKNQLIDKDTQIATTKQQGDQKARAASERGKKEALESLVNSYKKPFDDLIRSSSNESVLRDIQLIGDYPEIIQVLTDLQIYFNAKQLLAMKFDLEHLKNATAQLNKVKQNSALLDRLKESINSYQTFNDGLKETLGELIKLDKVEIVTGMS